MVWSILQKRSEMIRNLSHRVFFIIGFIIFFVFIGVNLIGLSTSPRIDASIIFIFITLMMCGFMVESFRLRDLLSKNKIPF